MGGSSWNREKQLTLTRRQQTGSDARPEVACVPPAARRTWPGCNLPFLTAFVYEPCNCEFVLRPSNICQASPRSLARFTKPREYLFQEPGGHPFDIQALKERVPNLPASVDGRGPDLRGEDEVTRTAESQRKTPTSPEITPQVLHIPNPASKRPPSPAPSSTSPLTQPSN